MSLSFVLSFTAQTGVKGVGVRYAQVNSAQRDKEMQREQFTILRWSLKPRLMQENIDIAFSLYFTDGWLCTGTWSTDSNLKSNLTNITHSLVIGCLSPSRLVVSHRVPFLAPSCSPGKYYHFGILFCSMQTTFRSICPRCTGLFGSHKIVMA